MFSIYKTLNIPIREVKGVGPEREKLLKKANIHTVSDVLTYFPRAYEDRSKVKMICEIEEEDECSFEGVIVGKVASFSYGVKNRVTKVIVSDETGTMDVIWFNQDYVKKMIFPGKRYIFYGKISTLKNKKTAQNPTFEPVDTSKAATFTDILPVYDLIGDLTQGILRSTIKNALEIVRGKLRDIIPPSICKEIELSNFEFCIRNIHFPESEESQKKARFRLVFEEFFMFQLILLSMKQNLQLSNEGIRFLEIQKDMGKFFRGLPFKLTGAQETVIQEIELDMESSKIMNRLVQGDVGSGKTVVAAAACFKAAKSGFQSAMMVPTEILARQHHKTLTKLLENTGVSVELLVGGMSKKEKLQRIEQIENGKIDVIVGTHALIENNIIFNRLGLVVTDEQHRFGVRQRQKLSLKGIFPDVIVMSATPIPRTLALMLYGDMDISIIDELPPGRKAVETYVVNNKMRERIHQFIKKQIMAGNQVFIVCPMIEESEKIEIQSVVQYTQKLQSKDLKDYQIGLIHGRMKPAEKEEMMDKFVSGVLDILVATTVIEVGVDVPNANVMLIENAERFGLAQLHQLRGRVGRGEKQAFCILFSEATSEIAKKRLETFGSTNDGFKISEKDLELRGPGEFFGVRQSGFPIFKIANLFTDMSILKRAQKTAQDFISNESDFENNENGLLKKFLTEEIQSYAGNLSFN